MKEDESKNTPTATEEQPENAQSVATVAAPDDTTPSGGEVERPDDPRDGEGCEAVTVVIVETSEPHALMAARSVKQNLVGADVLVARLAVDPQMTLIEALLRFVTEVTSSERIILMTDSMLLLNPTTIHEIGCRRGVLTDKGVALGEERTPKLMYRSVLLRLLPYLKDNYPHASIFLEYDQFARPEVMPLLMRPWNQDNWLLPVVSKNPPLEALQKWAKTQRFAWIAPQSWTDTVVKFLEERFPV